jgi:hypothetical protein
MSGVNKGDSVIYLTDDGGVAATVVKVYPSDHVDLEVDETGRRVNSVPAGKEVNCYQ